MVLAVRALTADNQLDKDAMLRFIEASQGFELTMHMAFDQIPLEDQAASIEWMKKVGVTRLLTRAGSPETDLEQRLQRYEEYAQLADRQLEILAGGGVSLENRQLFLDVPGWIRSMELVLSLKIYELRKKSQLFFLIFGILEERSSTCFTRLF